MSIKHGRFDEMSREEAITLLRELEGPLLELIMSWCSSDSTASDVFDEVLLAICDDPVLQVVFPDEGEMREWEVFRQKRGEGADEIGEFVYGARQNPWGSR